jgi:hypothetical protein
MEEGEMIKFVNRLIAVGLIVGSMSVIGMAKEIKKQVTFDEPVKVNGTVIKAGTYQVIFDEATSELTIFKGKKVQAKASASLEKLDKRSEQVYTLLTEANPESKVLTSVSLGNGNQAKLVNAGDTKAE